MNKKGFADPASATMGFLLLGAMTAVFSATVVGVGMTQENGAAKLKQDGKLIWCQMQNKGSDYCHAQYPRM
jgi:hypothetical protein